MEGIHIADTHIGVTTHGTEDVNLGMNTRVADFLESLDVAIDYVEEHGIELALFSGDAFHSRNPLMVYVSEFGARIQRLSRLCKVVMIPGNHDITVSRQVSTLGIFSKVDMPNVYATEQAGSFSIDVNGTSVYVACMPFPVLKQYVTTKEMTGLEWKQRKLLFMSRIHAKLDHLAAGSSGEDVRLFMGHFTVQGCQFGSERGMALGLDSEAMYEHVANPVYDYVALGHIHKFQDLSSGRKDVPPVVYSGSLDRVDFGEEQEAKGFVHFSIENGQTSYQFVDVDARPLTTVRLDVTDEANPQTAALRALEANKFQADAILRVIVDATSRTDVDAEAIEFAMRSRVYKVAAVEVNAKRVERTRTQQVGDMTAMTDEEQLESYLRTTNISIEESDTLLELFKEIKQDVSS